jgi:hypothetical protein
VIGARLHERAPHSRAPRYFGNRNACFWIRGRPAMRSPTRSRAFASIPRAVMEIALATVPLQRLHFRERGHHRRGRSGPPDAGGGDRRVLSGRRAAEPLPRRQRHGQDRRDGRAAPAGQGPVPARPLAQPATPRPRRSLPRSRRSTATADDASHGPVRRLADALRDRRPAAAAAGTSCARPDEPAPGRPAHRQGASHVARKTCRRRRPRRWAATG